MMAAGAVLTSLVFANFHSINVPPGTATPTNLQSFSLSTRSGTDIWRKPPGIGSSKPIIDDLNAPCFTATVPLASFRRARVTLDSKWSRVYDQGGLVLLFSPPTSGSNGKRAWLKTGIEMFDGIVNVATVATAATSTSDWSLLPVTTGQTSVTIEISRENINTETGKGAALLVYLISGEKKTLIREVTWAFAEDGGDIEIGTYLARPTKATGEESATGEVLTVNFTNLQVEVAGQASS